MYFKQEGAISVHCGKSLKLLDQFAYLGSNTLSTKSDINIHLGKVWNNITRLTKPYSTLLKKLSFVTFCQWWRGWVNTYIFKLLRRNIWIGFLCFFINYSTPIGSGWFHSYSKLLSWSHLSLFEFYVTTSHHRMRVNAFPTSPSVVIDLLISPCWSHLP